MVLGLHVATSCQKKDGEIEKLKRDLADTEGSVSHAKQMWLRESTRAALIMDQVEGTDRQRHTETDTHMSACMCSTQSELEKKLMDKEGQLVSVSRKLQDSARELVALKNLVTADRGDFPVRHSCDAGTPRGQELEHLCLLAGTG